jgi:DNA-binding NarL/FixJ family response regulator
LSNKDLAGLLHITEATVKVHLTNIFSKLGLRGRAELAAVYHGILHHSLAVAAR